jgi:hypothetical protein
MRSLTLMHCFAAMLLTALLGQYEQAAGQQVFVTFNVPGPASWNDPANWDPANVPEAQFNEVALIGALRSVYVDSAAPTVGGIIMDSSTLEIRSGGSLTAAPGSSTTGDLTMGQSVNTNLIVRRGGSLSVKNVVTGGGAGTTLTVGETGGAGTANFSVTGGTLNRITRIVGPNANFASSGDLIFGSEGTLNPVITGVTHSAINVSGTAFLGGGVRPEFSGFTPALGSSWNLVTASALWGDFSLDRSLLPDTPRGTGFYVSKTATAAKLNYSNLLILKVDRNTGATVIENAVGAPIGFDGYTIASPSGTLTGAWNSLQDQGLPAWDEAGNSGPTRLTEFKTSGTTSLSAGATRSLGSPFVPVAPTAIGQQPGADLSFQYAVPGVGTISGIVEMLGARNNLVLTINPATGEAAIQNESPYFDVAIDAYTISSASGKLLTGNAAWNSLQDQGLVGWDQADNSNVNRITEFKTTGATSMPGGGTVLDLGAPINIASGPLDIDDFSFEFKLSTGQTVEGFVEFGALPTPTPSGGDYDDDGDADGNDFLTWQRAVGSSVVPGTGSDGSGNGVVDGADLALWRSNFGSTGLGTVSAAAVPEPSQFALAAMASTGLIWGRLRRAIGAKGEAR